MQHRFRLAARTCAAAVLLAFVSACGGGGSSSPSTPATAVPIGPTPTPTAKPVGPTPTPTPAPVTATPAPGTLSIPGQQSSGGGAGGFVNDGKNASTYAVTSNPSGLAFTVAGKSYTTPATITPAASTTALSIVFTASGYTVPIVQVYDGPHTVFYNSASDSKGTVAVTSLQAIRRSAAASAARGTARTLHRALQHRRSTASDIDPTRLAVRFSAAALRTSGRSAAAVERAVGTVGRATLSATTDVLRVVSVPRGIDAAAFARKLQAQPEVAEVTAVHRRHILARAATTVTDPAFEIPDQWYTFASGANYAWSYNPGTGAKLAIVDTGIDDNNSDLSGQLAFQETAVTPIDNVPTSANGGVPTCDTVAGATTVVTPNTAQDDDGHGTNVASIAIAKANTAGFAGAAWGAQLLAFKVFPTQNQYCNDNSSNFGAGTPDEAQAIADAIAQGRT